MAAFDPQTFEPFALKLAGLAERASLPFFRFGGDVEDKNPTGALDPVTAADRNAEAAIRRALAHHHPDHGVIGEEYGEDRPDAEFVWVLDPVDGTRAFVAGLPLWTTLIALRHQGRPVLGLIAQPYVGEIFIGSAGGSRLIRPDRPDRPLKTRPCPTLSGATLSTTDPALFKDADALAWQRLRAACRLTRLGCDAYAYAMVAAGQMDVVAESGLKAWDVAPMAPLLAGAGGRIVDWSGAELPSAGGHALAVGDPALIDQAARLLA